MLRQLPAIILAATFWVSSCKKDTGSDKLTISGVHDLNLDSATLANGISLDVVHTSGVGDSVAILIQGLPRFLDYKLSSGSNIPDFATKLNFSIQSFPVIAGTYDVKVIGASKADTVSYDMVITIPDISGFYLGALVVPVQNTSGYLADPARLYRATSIVRGTCGTMRITSADYAGDTLTIVPAPGFSWPTADGSYAINTRQWDMRVAVLGCTNLANGISEFTLDIRGGKRSIKCSSNSHNSIAMYTPGLYVRYMGISVSE